MLRWDALVLATGARPRSLPFPVPRGVHTLRTLADARALRDTLVPGSRLVVVGGGFVGAEVASSAVSLGVEVTLVEALRAPFERILGLAVGQLLAERYRASGVQLLLGVGVVGFRATSNGDVQTVRLADGTELRCDTALIGIGIEPATELIPDPLDDAPLYACGDVTASGGHWTSAAAGGAAVAQRILGLPPAPKQPSFFWSDQFDLRLQLVGDTAHSIKVELTGDPDAFVARYRNPDGSLVAALTANSPTQMATLRRELAEQISGREPIPAVG